MTELNLCPDLNYKLKPNQPTICELRPQRVVTVALKGNPNTETALLMPPLYATAYAIRKTYKDKGSVFKVEKLRGRWPGITLTQDKSQWRGIYALPVPDDTAELPEIKRDKNPHNTNIDLTTWEYGKVAMVLHVGSYAAENTTVQNLIDFISDQGQSIIHDSHEEIYLSDPNKTDADNLKTIILYRLR